MTKQESPETLNRLAALGNTKILTILEMTTLDRELFVESGRENVNKALSANIEIQPISMEDLEREAARDHASLHEEQISTGKAKPFAQLSEASRSIAISETIVNRHSNYRDLWDGFEGVEGEVICRMILNERFQSDFNAAYPMPELMVRRNLGEPLASSVHRRLLASSRVANHAALNAAMQRTVVIERHNLSKVYQAAVLDYDATYATDIRSGQAFAFADLFITTQTHVAVQYIRHQFTNYDHLVHKFAEHRASGECWEIINAKTVESMVNKYPELATLIWRKMKDRENGRPMESTLPTL